MNDKIEVETCPECGGSCYMSCMGSNGGMTQIPCNACGGSGEVAELEREPRWIRVRHFPTQQGWYRVITNSGLEQIRQYKREPDRNIYFWDCDDGEWIMMWSSPPLPEPTKDGE